MPADIARREMNDAVALLSDQRRQFGAEVPRHGTLRLEFAAMRPRLPPTPKRHGLARVLSKLGYCSRTQASELIAAGRVRVDGRTVQDPERPTDARRERIDVDGIAVEASERVYLALNKPRGLIVSASDERGRETIYSLLESANARWLAPVGRLDRASEGLLFITNDPEWAARITNPDSAIEKTYHVQVSPIPDEALLDRMRTGVVDSGEFLKAVRVQLLRQGQRNAWLEIVLDEGKNRHIRRMLQALELDVLRLVRVAIGPVALGTLPKGQWRQLTEEERASFRAVMADGLPRSAPQR